MREAVVIQPVVRMAADLHLSTVRVRGSADEDAILMSPSAERRPRWLRRGPAFA